MLTRQRQYSSPCRWRVSDYPNAVLSWNVISLLALAATLAIIARKLAVSWTMLPPTLALLPLCLPVLGNIQMGQLTLVLGFIVAAIRALDVHFASPLPASSALDKPRGLWDLVDGVMENNVIRAIVTWMSPMPFPFAETVALTDPQRAQLESLVRAGSTPQALVFRCRLILRAAERDHPSNLQIAAEFGCNRHTVAMWRNRYLVNGLAGLQDAPRSGRPRRFSPSERLDLINLASSTTEQQGCPATRWSLDDLAATLINQTAHALAMSRSTIWRVLDEADLKPHRSVYWLNSHDPDFDAKAQAICKLYVEAPVMYQQGRLVICCDEKTGMQALGRPHPTQPAEPGKPARREQDYIRYGTRAFIASFIVPTGEVIGDLGPTRTSVDFAAHLGHVAGRFPEIKGFDWVLDNLNTHWSLEVCRVVAQLCDVPFVPAHLETGQQRRAFLTDPDPQACVPLHSDAWLLAQSSGTVV